MTRLFTLLVSSAALAQVSEPRLGVTREPIGTVRAWLGVAGAFVPGEVLSHAATASAASDTRTVIAEEGTLVINGKPFEVPAGPAVIGLDGDVVLAWFAESGTLLRITGGVLERLPVDAAVFAGDVRALYGRLVVMVSRPDGLFRVKVRPTDGAVEHEERAGDPEDGPVIVLENGTLIFTRMLEEKAGEPIRSMERMSGSWIHAATATRSLAFHFRCGKLEMFTLPELVQ